MSDLVNEARWLANEMKNDPKGDPALINALADALEVAEKVCEEAEHLYERVEMDESVGICLSDRVPSLRLGEALRAWRTAR